MRHWVLSQHLCYPPIHIPLSSLINGPGGVCRCQAKAYYCWYKLAKQCLHLQLLLWLLECLIGKRSWALEGWRKSNGSFVLIGMWYALKLALIYFIFHQAEISKDFNGCTCIYILGGETKVKCNIVCIQLYYSKTTGLLIIYTIYTSKDDAWSHRMDFNPKRLMLQTKSGMQNDIHTHTH